MITFERSEKNPNSDISQWSTSRTDNPLDYIVREDVIQAKYENSVSGDERERFENILTKKNDKEISRNRIPKDRHTISKAFSTEITTDKIHKNVKQEKISHVSARNTAGDNLRHAKSEMNIINGSHKINNSRSSTDLFQDDPVKINMFKSLFVKGDIRMDHVVDQAVATVLNKQGKTGKKYHHTDSKNIENELQNARNELDSLEKERKNKKRLVELTEYEYDRYRSHKNILKVMAYGALSILFVVMLMSQSWFPSTVGVALICIIIVAVLVTVGIRLLDNFLKTST